MLENPANTGRFRVYFPEDCESLTATLTSVRINIVKKTISMQFRNCEMSNSVIEALRKLANSRISLAICHFSKLNEEGPAMTFSDVTVIDHEYDLSYYNNEAASHKVTFSYSSLT